MRIATPPIIVQTLFYCLPSPSTPVRLHCGPFRNPAGFHAQAYLENVALTQPGVRRVCLVSKAGLLGMYTRCGFVVQGPSQLVFGRDVWYEMAVDLDSTEPRLRRFVQVCTAKG